MQLFAFLIFLSACKRDEIPRIIKGPATFSENSVLIEGLAWKDNIKSIDTLNGVFIFNSDPGLTTGDIMITEEGEGWIRKVTGAQKTSNGIVINTEFASLCDAVEEVSASIKQIIEPEKKSGWHDLAKGVTIRPSQRNEDNSGLHVNFDWIVYDADGRVETEDDRITMSGLYEMKSDIELGIEIRESDLKKLLINYAIDEKARIGVTSSIDMQIDKLEQRLMRNNAIPPVVLFPGCIIKPIFELWAGVDVKNAGAFSAEFENMNDYVAGLTFENGSWSTDKSINQNESSNQPALSTPVSAQVYLKPKLLLKINGVLTSKLEADLYNKLESMASQTGLSWELSKGFEMGVEIDMKVFKNTSPNFTYDFFDIKGIVSKDSIILYNNEPEAAFTAAPVSGSSPLNVEFTDQSTNFPISWLWSFGDGSTSDLQNPSHTYQTAGLYDVTLSVSNDFGSDDLTEIGYVNVSQGSSANTVTDIDGNVYLSVDIGTQTWMAENLKVTHYRDGSAINNAYISSEWSNLDSGAYVWYDNDITWKDAYGALYNWYTVNSPEGLCPVGWHVPSDDEWTTLINFTGGESESGGKLKSTRNLNDPHPRWHLPNTGATDQYGYSALPGGYRSSSGGFDLLQQHFICWSSTPSNLNFAWARNMHYYNTQVNRHFYYVREGFSVRCLKD